MKSDQVYREAARRIHVRIAAYLTHVAWVRGLDCVVVERDALLPHLGISRMERTRIAWLTSDVASAFPHTKARWYVKPGRPFAAIYLSRRPFPAHCFLGEMPPHRRAELLTNNGLRTEVVTAFPSESEIIERLARLAHGLASFTEFESSPAGVAPLQRVTPKAKRRTAARKTPAVKKPDAGESF